MRYPIKKIYQKVKIDLITGCHNWLGSRNKKGYGTINMFSAHFPKKKIYLAHRFMWDYVNGPIPDGMYVLHTCDNRCCVNPSHLYIGTQLENMADMYVRGRANKAKGETHFRSVLDTPQVIQIKTLIKNGLKPMAISRRLDVKRHLILDIRRGRTWSHVTV